VILRELDNVLLFYRADRGERYVDGRVVVSKKRN
jgi:hypothetical protein